MYPISKINLDLQFIPRNRTIEKHEIENLHDNQITELKNYIYYTFPSISYSQINNLLIMAMIFVNKLPNNCLVLCPGDSPFRFTYLIEYMYKNGAELQYITTTILNGVQLSYEQKKDIVFMRFPLSGITNKTNDETLRKYLIDKLKIDAISMTFNNIAILDHISLGTTLYKLRNVLQPYFISKEFITYNMNS